MNKTWETFSKNYEKLLLEEYGHDLIVNVGEEPLVKSFKAHKVILGAQSPYFRRALSNEWAKQEDGKIVFNKPNVSPPIFDVILKYIYTGSTNVEEQDGEFILSLLTAADELILQEFVEEVQHYLVNNRATWIQENFCHVLDFAFSHSTYGQLQDHCLEAICADPPLLFDSEYFYCIDSTILKSLLKRDDLAIHEVDLWNNLIKWANVQITEIEAPSRNLNVDDVDVDSTEWKIFGMYISSVWSNNTARQHDSFMFSFGEGRETRTPVLSRVRAAGYDLALQRGQERGLNGQKRKHGKIIVEIKFAVIPSILIQL
ncbi:unnamed protein product [Rhizophagus irregularis]|nr:unnamed protein product [Rhizophagus irregularis]